MSEDLFLIVGYFFIWMLGGILVITWLCFMIKVVEILVKAFGL